MEKRKNNANNEIILFILYTMSCLWCPIRIDSYLLCLNITQHWSYLYWPTKKIKVMRQALNNDVVILKYNLLSHLNHILLRIISLSGMSDVWPWCENQMSFYTLLQRVVFQLLHLTYSHHHQPHHPDHQHVKIFFMHIKFRIVISYKITRKFIR